jgi:hypothetical protein
MIRGDTIETLSTGGKTSDIAPPITTAISTGCGCPYFMGNSLDDLRFDSNP